MAFEIDLRLYALANTLDTSVVGTESLTFYFLFQNPIDKVAYDAALAADATDVLHYNSFVGFDGLLGTLTISETSGPPTLITLGSLSLADIWCPNTITEGAYDSSNCKSDGDGTKTGGANDYSEKVASSPTSYCEESWSTSPAGTSLTDSKCVRIKATGKRFFQTGDNALTDGTGSVDIDFAYREYSVSTGWEIVAANANAPGKQDFAAKNIDFSTFLRVPATYSSALYGLQVAGSAIAIAVLSIAF